MPQPTAESTEFPTERHVIPPDAGLSRRDGLPPEREPRSGDELLTAAANGDKLAQQENDDLVAYFLSNDGLPGDSETLELSVSLGRGSAARTFRCEVHPIEWSEWQDARERATAKSTGEFDAFISSSWIVARALVTPKLGPTVARLQAEDRDSAPGDAAELLRRMFRRQSGALLELSGKVLELSKLQSDSDSVKEVEAAKN